MRLFAASRDDPEYQCRSCGRRFSVQYHVCPDCSGYGVDPVADVEGSHGSEPA